MNLFSDFDGCGKRLREKRSLRRQGVGDQMQVLFRQYNEIGKNTIPPLDSQYRPGKTMSWPA